MLGSGSPIAAAVELGRRHGLADASPVVLKDGSNLIVRLDPAGVVVRVATVTAWVRGDPRPYLEREVELTAALTALGAAVAPPTARIPPGPHEIAGWHMTALAGVDHAGLVPTGAETLEALDILHGKLRQVALDLPFLGPAIGDLDRAWEAVARLGDLGNSEIERRRVRRDELVTALEAVSSDRQALHGDAFPRNSLVTPAGIVWIDLEDACTGPVAWDHAVLIRQGNDASLEPLLRGRDGDEAVQLAMDLRGLQGEAWHLIHVARAAGRLPIPASFAGA